jgi:putative nucleotidyltransferase with HDIG domain
VSGPTRERVSRLEELLSRSPPRIWPDGIIHHGARVALLLVLGLLVALLFPPTPRTVVAPYEVGMVAEEDITASVAFAVPKSEEELELERAAAAAAIPPTFTLREGATGRMVSNLDGFFQGLADAVGRGPGAVEEELAGAGIRATLRQVELATDPQVRDGLRRAALRATRDIHPDGVIDASQSGYLVTERFTVRSSEGEESSVPSSQVITTREFFDRAVGILPSGTSPEVEELLRLILIRFVETNYVLDAAETFRDKDQARRSVATTGSSVLEGEVILRRGERVQPVHLTRLQAYAEALRIAGRLENEGAVDRIPFLGSLLLNLAVLVIFGLVLWFYRPEVYLNFRWMLLHGGLVAAYFMVAQRIHLLGLPAELLPITFVALTIAVLWDSRQALMLTAILAAMTALQPPFRDHAVLAVTLLGGSAAAFSVRAITRRAQTWVVIGMITVAYAVTLLSLGLVVRAPAIEVLSAIGYAAINATASAILAMGFLPLWEWYTQITTGQSLLEWADPNRPLLKRLSLEAPGTYAHSINVANLAEAAANAVGANGLLCRVGAYYHDVGKVLKPQFFIENQPGGRNPHDKLKPVTSAGIVREHVTEGLRLARESKVPRIVEPFISEHHGTQLIGFFYQKAVEDAGEADAPDPASFRYPGPPPQSRETAILMIADSVESATKVLQDPTPERVKTLVDNLVESKLEQDQFAQAPITLAELEVVKETLVKVVSGMYHHRIDYPQTKHLTDAGSDAAPSDAVAGAPTDGAGSAQMVLEPEGDETP